MFIIIKNDFLLVNLFKIQLVFSILLCYTFSRTKIFRLLMIIVTSLRIIFEIKRGFLCNFY